VRASEYSSVLYTRNATLNIVGLRAVYVMGLQTKYVEHLSLNICLSKETKTLHTEVMDRMLR
jgi:hypothetical protein